MFWPAVRPVLAADNPLRATRGSVPAGDLRPWSVAETRKEDRTGP